MKNEDELYKAADIILSLAPNAVTGKMEDYYKFIFAKV